MPETIIERDEIYQDTRWKKHTLIIREEYSETNASVIELEILAPGKKKLKYYQLTREQYDTIQQLHTDFDTILLTEPIMLYENASWRRHTLFITHRINKNGTTIYHIQISGPGRKSQLVYMATIEQYNDFLIILKQIAKIAFRDQEL